MIDKSGGKTEDFTTVIGADAVFKGELAFEKGVRVDGRVEGKISTRGQLAVSKGGMLQADVNAGAIFVEGQVQGNLNAADRVELRQTARLKGDIKATTLLVAEGATFVGHCMVGPEAGKTTPPQHGMPGGQNAQTPNRVAEVLPKK